MMYAVSTSTSKGKSTTSVVVNFASATNRVPTRRAIPPCRRTTKFSSASAPSKYAARLGCPARSGDSSPFEKFVCIRRVLAMLLLWQLRRLCECGLGLVALLGHGGQLLPQPRDLLNHAAQLRDDTALRAHLGVELLIACRRRSRRPL